MRSIIYVKELRAIITGDHVLLRRETASFVTVALPVLPRKIVPEYSAPRGMQLDRPKCNQPRYRADMGKSVCDLVQQ